MFFDPSDVATPEPPTVRSRKRGEIPDRFKWNLGDIFPDWETWENAYKRLDSGIEGSTAELVVNDVVPHLQDGESTDE